MNDHYRQCREKVQEAATIRKKEQRAESILNEHKVKECNPMKQAGT